MSKVLVVTHNPVGQNPWFLEMTRDVSVIEGSGYYIPKPRGSTGVKDDLEVTDPLKFKDWIIIEEISKYPTKLLTQPEKKANIAPSTLLVKLIGRI